jgi:hypothetical protein
MEFVRDERGIDGSRWRSAERSPPPAAPPLDRNAPPLSCTPSHRRGGGALPGSLPLPPPTIPVPPAPRGLPPASGGPPPKGHAFGTRGQAFRTRGQASPSWGQRSATRGQGSATRGQVSASWGRRPGTKGRTSPSRGQQASRAGSNGVPARLTGVLPSGPLQLVRTAALSGRGARCVRRAAFQRSEPVSLEPLAQDIRVDPGL